MNNKEEILEKAKNWFRETILPKHINNTKKLVNPNEFNINPFLTVYLANFLTGNSEPESLAKALLLPRVLGTSITTSFGQNIQSFTNILLDGFGSTTSGIDIEFIDQIDGNRKYCQLKLGPNTINKDDVETIAGHFTGVINLARTNNLRIAHDDMIVGIIYGTPKDLSSHYKRITSQYHYPVFIGSNFWHRLTGDEDFYSDLLDAIGSVAIESDFSKEFQEVITKLSETDQIKNLK
ncbi:MAG: PmeII family type II restriction endonuclease [Gammaproteobacteria bacterium]|nr:PmeII family type II restriction endonuclease [Gammaproteobacteria bacterium]